MARSEQNRSAMTAETLAICAQAALENPVKAAERFLQDVNEADKDIVMRLMHLANSSKKRAESFTRSSQAVLMETKWGKFWLVPDGLVGLNKQYPSVGPSGLRVLARGVVLVLTR